MNALLWGVLFGMGFEIGRSICDATWDLVARAIARFNLSLDK